MKLVSFTLFKNKILIKKKKHFAEIICINEVVGPNTKKVYLK